jgi:hypothetical protein
MDMNPTLDTVKLFWDLRLEEWRLSDDSKFDITLNNYHVAARGLYTPIQSIGPVPSRP